MIYRYFFPDYDLPFHFLNRVFQRAEVLNLDKVQFIIFFLFYGLCFLCPKKSVPIPRSQRFLSVFSSSRSYIILALWFCFILYCLP